MVVYLRWRKATADDVRNDVLVFMGKIGVAIEQPMVLPVLLIAAPVDLLVPASLKNRRLTGYQPN